MALRELGFDVGHETWGKDGQVGFHAAVELRGAKPSAQWRPNPDPNDIVLHQVRHPLQTISSFQTAQDYTWDYVCAYAPIDRDGSVLHRCMQYWYHWNLLAEKHAALTFRIESIADNWPLICRLLKLDELTPLPKETTKGWHKRGHTMFKWKDLKKEDKPLMREIKSLGRRYGYKID